MENKTTLPAKGNNKPEIVFYQPNETIRLEVRMEEDTVWLTQTQMAQLFGCTKDNIGLHLKNIYIEKEIDEDSTTEYFSVVRKEGNRFITRTIQHYNLDAILSVGYRISSKNATLFRRWATFELRNIILNRSQKDRQLIRIENRIDEINSIVKRHDHFIAKLEAKHLPPTEGVFFAGQVFDAYVFVSQLIEQANTRIILIDNYIDTSVLTLLDKRKDGVSAQIYTKSISAQMQLDLERHDAQYSPIQVCTLPDIHDRFLIIDDTLYHIGASIKDLGKKLFAFTKMEMKAEVMMKVLGI